VTAYGILSRGILSDSFDPNQPAAPGDLRSRFPRFSPQNAQHNLQLVQRLQSVAREKGASVAELAVAWVASRG
jgi:aryl-alcohol dehydrogenase-like predicted oxidoreductase